MEELKGNEMETLRKGFLILLKDFSFPGNYCGQISKRHPANLKKLNGNKDRLALTVLPGDYHEKDGTNQHQRQISIFNGYLSKYLKHDQKPILRVAKNSKGRIGFEAECPDATYTVISTFHLAPLPLQCWKAIFQTLKIVFEIPNFVGEELLKEIPK